MPRGRRRVREPAPVALTRSTPTEADSTANPSRIGGRIEARMFSGARAVPISRAAASWQLGIGIRVMTYRTVGNGKVPSVDDKARVAVAAQTRLNSTILRACAPPPSAASARSTAARDEKKSARFRTRVHCSTPRAPATAARLPGTTGVASQKIGQQAKCGCRGGSRESGLRNGDGGPDARSEVITPARDHRRGPPGMRSSASSQRRGGIGSLAQCRTDASSLWNQQHSAIQNNRRRRGRVDRQEHRLAMPTAVAPAIVPR